MMAGAKVSRRRWPQGARRLRRAVSVPDDMISRHLGQLRFWSVWLDQMQRWPNVERVVKLQTLTIMLDVEAEIPCRSCCVKRSYAKENGLNCITKLCRIC